MPVKWLIVALTYLCFVQGESPCITPDQKPGDCRRIDLCEPLYRLIKPEVLAQPDELSLLRQSKCGFDQAAGLAKVCCATAESTTLANHPGPCVNILDCEHIRNKLYSPSVTQEYKDYLNSIRCQGTARYSVYCGPPPGPELVPTLAPTLGPSRPLGSERLLPSQSRANAGCRMSAQPPDPASNCCGCSGFIPRIIGGSDASIDQYPWQALIEYAKDNKIRLLCGGVLISGRYVLTAGHCVVGPVLKLAQPVNVRLGEYDTSNEGPDCVELDGGDEDEKECTLDPVIIPIERIIPHPGYNSSNRLRRNDIAMLRLASIPAYTNFVRPICLPTVDITATDTFSKNGTLFAAGWGAVSDKISYSKIKQHVSLPFKSYEVCQQSYNIKGRMVPLWDHQVCAGGELGKDSCKGDSGGPLIYTNGTYSELIGIVSFGPVPCGMENVPGVYTKVFEYMTWIRSNIQP